MGLPELVLDTIDSALESYQYNPDYSALILESLCFMFPDIPPRDLEEGVTERLGIATEQMLGGTDLEDDIATERMIAGTDLDDALGMNDKHSSIDYLGVLYPNLTRKEIKKQFKRAVKNQKRKSSSKKRKILDKLSKEAMDFQVESIEDETSPKRKKRKSSKRSKKTITDEDIDEALEFYGFSFGPDLKDKIVKYMMAKYPSVPLNKIVEELSGYDFDNKIGSPERPHGTPEFRLTTPPRRGSSYEPSDFSPSSYGAASSGAIDFLRKKRSKYLPDYTSPPPTPLPTPGTPTRKRFRDELSPPPRTPKRSRRLSFSRSPDHDGLS